MEEDQTDKDNLTANEGHTSEEDKDWADHESVTTDEEPSSAPPAKKNIHARRWKLIPKDDGSFIIEGGRKPKEIRIMPRSEIFENQKHLAEADFILFVPLFPAAQSSHSSLQLSHKKKSNNPPPHPQTAPQPRQIPRPKRPHLAWYLPLGLHLAHPRDDGGGVPALPDAMARVPRLHLSKEHVPVAEARAG
ncbi:hypothetical protein V501_05098 [Pseudogymnoascus sp. VKM F-4519 (FW-2642)]|nr:hypothetical protein V501_05098 [Pseudogymnoascus sp. VKM F-4519 (FW-2642)]